MRLVGFLIVLVAATVLTQAAAPPTQPSSDPVIRRLIEELGSDTFAVREDASRKLLKRPEAAPALRHALHSTDREVVRRAKDILDVFASRHRGWLLEQMKADARAGRADLLAERLVHWPGADSEPGCWQPVFDLCREQLDRLPQRIRETLESNKFLPRCFEKYAASAKISFHHRLTPVLDIKIPDGGVPFGRSEAVTCDNNLHGSVFITSGSSSFCGLSGGFVVTGSSVKKIGNLTHQVLIAEGDIVLDAVKCSIVITHGKIRCTRRVWDSVLLSETGIELGPSVGAVNSVFRSAGPIVRHQTAQWQKCEFSDNDNKALASLCFFELKHVGLEVSGNSEGLRIDRLTSISPLTSAGLKVGDFIIRVEGVEVRKAEELRQILRRKVAIGERFTCQVLRAGNRLNIQTTFQR